MKYQDLSPNELYQCLLKLIPLDNDLDIPTKEQHKASRAIGKIVKVFDEDMETGRKVVAMLLNDSSLYAMIYGYWIGCSLGILQLEDFKQWYACFVDLCKISEMTAVSLKISLRVVVFEKYLEKGCSPMYAEQKNVGHYDKEYLKKVLLID